MPHNEIDTKFVAYSNHFQTSVRERQKEECLWTRSRVNTDKQGPVKEKTKHNYSKMDFRKAFAFAFIKTMAKKQKHIS